MKIREHAASSHWESESLFLLDAKYRRHGEWVAVITPSARYNNLIAARTFSSVPGITEKPTYRFVVTTRRPDNC